MQISRKSWHYRLYNFNWNFWKDFPEYWFQTVASKFGGDKPWPHEYHPKSLCRYFWFTLLSTLVAPIVALAMFFFLFVILLGALPVLGVMYLWDDAHAYGRQRRWAQSGGPQTTKPRAGLVVEYIKARKQKVCPIIELVD